ncbi:MAG: type II CRISPR RNA-guided endonuclease Cas9 [Alphaproteobacteria bacterium]
MERIFGLDIGTTSIGFAVIEHDYARETGQILRLGARIFPESRDMKDLTPLNQQRRQKRMMRRQCRRRRVRRQLLNEMLSKAGLLPSFGSPEWPRLMALDPYALRDRGLDEPLELHEIGRLLYHLAKRRHFKGRDIDDSREEEKKEDADEVKANSERETTLATLKAEGVTLGRWLSRRDPHVRKRGVHASRVVVEKEFEQLWTAQSVHHAVLRDSNLMEQVREVAFAQKPVFWRKKTLGECRFEPGARLCPEGSWLSMQRRMLEKVNNLALTGGNGRPLDDEERAAILAVLGSGSQATMTWGGVRKALKPLYKARGEAGRENSFKFNLEQSEKNGLKGNLIEAKLLGIFGGDWADHPHKQAIRDAIHERLWGADYGEVGDQRVVIRSQEERDEARKKAAQSFIDDFGITPEQAAALKDLSLPSGWEPYSISALQRFLPHLEKGVKFGALLNGPDWETWRNQTFPNQKRPTGEFHDRLPSPSKRNKERRAEGEEEARRIAEVRNPTVIRIRNELRKVVNNLIDLYGKPDRIRVELARDVGKSKREREEIQSGIQAKERRRTKAADALTEQGLIGKNDKPSHTDVEKWLLWKECQERCPYTGDHIGFDALFREGHFEVEHIWPRSRSYDNSFRNKTLCRKDVNIAKANKTPYEYFGHRPEQWEEIKQRLDSMKGMSPSKVRRFLATEIPEGFVSRQLNDTGYATRLAVEYLKLLWPDAGPEAPVTVQAVSGKVTAQLRKYWGLNNILSDDGEKTRADHRHHAIDALAIACASPRYTQELSLFLQAKDDPTAERPNLSPPWATIRNDAEVAVEAILISHRVQKKVSGPLHKETVYGDTREDVTTKTGTYRQFVVRKKVEALSKGEVGNIRDDRVRAIVTEWITTHGGDPKKAFATYPRIGDGGPEIRKVRLLIKQQLTLMAPVSTGYADLGNNHHIAIYRRADGSGDFEVVSLFEASRRLIRREPVVRRDLPGATFVMSLAPGDAVEFPEGEKKGIRIVQSVWASGQIVTVDHRDAVGTTVWRPSTGSVVKGNARKVSIDPIGRIRPAND